MHHMGLFWSRVHRQVGHPEAGCMAICAWATLANQQHYLVHILDEMGADEAQRLQAIDEMVLAPLVLAGSIAAGASGELSKVSSAAALLGAATRLPLEDPWRSRIAEVAERTLQEALAQRLDPLEAQLASLPESPALAEMVKKVDEVWRCFEHDVRVERFIAQHVVDPLWPVYRALKDSEFLVLVEPIELAVESLVRRVERGEELAFLAGAVDMLAFFAFAQPDDQVAASTYERILKIFPTHRNAQRRLSAITARRQ
jgi:hypothetical protein